ncbi:metalloregulator ArsR/SmtB family transcription factor [Guyparkeria halophila]|uniref:Metalloregulator ArsR/SmtB family transcription factor n=1 Tax=Guyparkeria halophila TaxID=47960 RepID=A0ABZ0YWZ4_9GAMM|nr:metalloregulator ArsR/SmtB family transcription factor [Guyparkeria halophila]WQH16693.1 metalloregulator ArsR/SmtB family transcription factor [Guyparkeria halophila]
MSPIELFSVLSHPTRLRLALLMAEQGTLCVCELQHAVDEDQPRVSRHLANLRQAGVIEGERRAQWVDYRLSPDLPGWAHTILDEALAGMQDDPAFVEDRRRLTAMGERPGAACPA